MPMRHAIGVLACLLLAACGAAPAAAPPVLRAAAAGDGNSLAIDVAGPVATLDVHSSSGIGSATVELVSGAWPATVELRLHTRGLEQFRLAYNSTVVAAAVASDGGQPVRQHLLAPDGGERPIDAASPHWLALQVVSRQPEPSFPLQDGYFAITLPQDFVRGQQRSFTIHWIDFFR